MRIVKAIQVSVSLFNKNTKEREISGLHKAVELYDLDSGFIITEEEDTIHIKPVWKWLLSNYN